MTYNFWLDKAIYDLSKQVKNIYVSTNSNGYEPHMSLLTENSGLKLKKLTQNTKRLEKKKKNRSKRWKTTKKLGWKTTQE